METSNHIEQLQAGRKAMQATGKSPRQVGYERAKKALKWIYEWGWSTPSNIELLVGGNKSGLARRLAKQGLINRTRTASGGGHREVPAYILTLTKRGEEEVVRDIERAEDLLPYQTDPYRINQLLMRHDNMVQTATLKALLKGDITSYRTPAQLAEGSKVGVKQPDALWITQGEGFVHRLAIEVELTPKWHRHLDRTISAYVNALTGEDCRFDQVMFISDSLATIERYQKAFSPGREYHFWKKDNQNNWVTSGSGTVPVEVSERVICQHVQPRY